MARYEVLTRMSNGRKRPHEIGAIVEMNDTDAVYLVTNGSLRPVEDTSAEQPAAPVGTSQRVAAAATQHEGAGFLTAINGMRSDLSGQSHRALGKIIATEKVGEIPAVGAKPTVAEKVEAIIAARAGKMFSVLNREGLLMAAASEGFANLAALQLEDEATDDAIRAALMRVAAAQAA